MKDLLAFIIADKEYAVDIAHVIRVLKGADIISVPETPDYVEGVINFDNNVVPVINIKKKLSINEDTADEIRYVIIAQIHGSFVGLIVDTITDVITIDAADITPPEGLLKDARYLMGIIKKEESMTFVMDIEKFAAEDSIMIEQTRGKVEIRSSTENKE